MHFQLFSFLLFQDDQLTEIMILLRDGYSKKTIQDRLNYGIQLKKALEDFAQTFLPHMKEEEEVLLIGTYRISYCSIL